MQKLIVANWKMNGSLEKINLDIGQYTDNPHVNSSYVILALPYVYLLQAQFMLRNRYKIANESEKYNYFVHKDHGFKVAAQDISCYLGYGAYTGEISGNMLKDIGVSYAIIGHSERRSLFNEADAMLLNKLENALASNIIPIFCIGENFTLRKDQRYRLFILQQLELLCKVEVGFNALVIAYEPIWSIGTGVIPSEAEISEIVQLIRTFMQNKLPRVKITLLYGGSVTASNIQSILLLDGIDGVLVGGASLDVDKFKQICLYAVECAKN